MLRRIAVEAHRDPRVVRAVLRDGSGTATSYSAVVDAVKALGLNIVVPPRCAVARALASMRRGAQHSEPPPDAAA
jgi:hypothetical protein